MPTDSSHIHSEFFSVRASETAPNECMHLSALARLFQEVAGNNAKELSFDPPHVVKPIGKGAQKALDGLVGLWNKSYGKMIPQLKIDPKHANLKRIAQKIKDKAFRDKDDEMMPLVMKGETTVVTEQVINNSGGTNVIPVYSPTSPMLT